MRWEALPSISPLNGCLCVVLVADLRVGRAERGGLIYSWLWLWPHWLNMCVCVCSLSLCVFQVIVQSGRQPSVLQKLCQLPFQYFSHPRLIKVLFPSLIGACYNNLQNKVILQQEMSCVLLATFIQVNRTFKIKS